MQRPTAAAVQQVAVVGLGSIGGGLTCHFLRAGLDVVCWDRAPDAADRLRRTIERKWPLMERLGLAPGASPERWRVAPSLERAVGEAEFVQESVPEDLATKQETFARIDRAADPSVVIASATSGFLCSDIAAACRTSLERCVVAHPFHPAYLLPLVEVVPGDRTSAETVEWTREFYRAQGKVTVTCSPDSLGFIANRLQAAVLRESLHMVANGAATVEDIDAALCYGPGLRWAFMGQFLAVHLSSDGIDKYFEKFPGELERPYTEMEAPPLTDLLRAEVESGALSLAAGRSIDQLADARDENLLKVLSSIEPMVKPSNA